MGRSVLPHQWNTGTTLQTGQSIYPYLFSFQHRCGQKVFCYIRHFHNVQVTIPNPCTELFYLKETKHLQGLLLQATKSQTDQALLYSKKSTAVAFFPLILEIETQSSHCWKPSAFQLECACTMQTISCFLELKPFFFSLQCLSTQFIPEHELVLSWTSFGKSQSLSALAQEALHSPHLTIFALLCTFLQLACDQVFVKCRGLARLYMQH